MWKIKDRIKFIKNGIHDTTVSHGFTIGRIYSIIFIEKVRQGTYADKYGYKYCVIKDSGDQWWIEPNSFKLVRDNLSEVDYLDAFKQNFEDGI